SLSPYLDDALPNSLSHLPSSTDPTPTQTYTLSLHDALPISSPCCLAARCGPSGRRPTTGTPTASPPTAWRSKAGWTRWRRRWTRSEEHTSELQSRENLVCRLLLEKKKKKVAASQAHQRIPQT